jgi:hypothetical protein
MAQKVQLINSRILLQPELLQLPNENRVDEDCVDRLGHRDPPRVTVIRRNTRPRPTVEPRYRLGENLVHLIEAFAPFW